MKENVSALMDDALEDDDLLAAVDALASEPELQQAWSMYQLTGDVLRAVPAPVVDVTAGVMAALDETQADSAPQGAAGVATGVAKPPRKPIPL